jgi:hypothetical protein
MRLWTSLALTGALCCVAPLRGAEVPAGRDVDAIKRAGVLRVLTFGDDGLLARAGSPAPDLDLASTLAERLGVQLVEVRAAKYADLIPCCSQGPAT